MSYFRFNQIVGRLQSSGVTSYVPQGLARSTGSSAPICRDVFTKLAEVGPLPRGTPVARMSTAVAKGGNLGVVPNTAHYKKVQKLQDHFLQNDGKLVWQKMGARDMAAYYSIWALIITGFLLWGDLAWNWVDPLHIKKQR